MLRKVNSKTVRNDRLVRFPAAPAPQSSKMMQTVSRFTSARDTRPAVARVLVVDDEGRWRECVDWAARRVRRAARADGKMAVETLKRERASSLITESPVPG